MLALRIVFGLLLLAGLACFVVYVASGNPAWRQRGIAIIKGTVIAGLVTAAAITLEHLLS
jgi:uncharacterized membrane protein